MIFLLGPEHPNSMKMKIEKSHSLIFLELEYIKISEILKKEKKKKHAFQFLYAYILIFSLKK